MWTDWECIVWWYFWFCICAVGPPLAPSPVRSRGPVMRHQRDTCTPVFSPLEDWISNCRADRSDTAPPTVKLWIYMHCPLPVASSEFPFLLAFSLCVNQWIYTHCPLVVSSSWFLSLMRTCWCLASTSTDGPLCSMISVSYVGYIMYIYYINIWFSNKPPNF